MRPLHYLTCLFLAWSFLITVPCVSRADDKDHSSAKSDEKQDDKKPDEKKAEPKPPPRKLNIVLFLADDK